MTIKSTSTAITHSHGIDGYDFSDLRSNTTSRTGTRSHISRSEGKMVSCISCTFYIPTRVPEINDGV